MKKLKFFTLLVLTPFLLQAQSQKAKKTLEKVIQIMREQSVNSDSVDWALVTAEAYRLAEKAKSPYELGNSIRYLYQSLDDFHGSFRYKDSTFRWMKEKFSWSKIPSAKAYSKEFSKRDNRVHSTMLSDNVGYLRIPTSTQDEATEKSTALQDSLARLIDQNPAGLILDLRLNGGGHFPCMIIGISQVFPYGPITPEDEIREDGFYRITETNILSTIYTFAQRYKTKNIEIPIAVITGPFTASSGEGLTMVLKNRPNTIVIGEPTAGWVSAVNGLKVDRNSHINLSVGYMTDTKNTIYRSKIAPDVQIIGGDNFDSLLQDTKILDALKWLREHHK